MSEQLAAFVFFFSAILTLVGGFLVFYTKNIVRTVFSLLAALLGVAGLYLCLSADFLAAVQLLVYVGGVLVLIAFGVMLTGRMWGAAERETSTWQIFTGLILFLMLFFTLVLGMIYRTVIANAKGELVSGWSIDPQAELYGPMTQKTGEFLLNQYLLPFEIASVVLLVALIGAVFMSRRGK